MNNDSRMCRPSYLVGHLSLYKGRQSRTWSVQFVDVSSLKAASCNAIASFCRPAPSNSGLYAPMIAPITLFTILYNPRAGWNTQTSFKSEPGGLADTVSTKTGTNRQDSLCHIFSHIVCGSQMGQVGSLTRVCVEDHLGCRV